MISFKTFCLCLAWAVVSFGSGERPFANLPAEHLKEQIIGVEILVAEEGAQVQSSFGHAMLRLVDKDGLWANDTVISFVADPGSERINLLSGAVGKYPVKAEVLSLREHWEKYPQMSGRGFKRHILNLSRGERLRLLDALFESVQNEKALGDYKFFSNNCSSVLTKVFNTAGITADVGDLERIPRSLGKWVDKNLVSAFAPVKTETYEGAKAFIRKNPPFLLKDLKRKFSDNELAYIFLNHPFIKFEEMEKIAAYLRAKNVDMDASFGLKPLPPILYTKNFGPAFYAAEANAFTSAQRSFNRLRRLRQANLGLQARARLMARHSRRPGERLHRFFVKSSEDGARARLYIRDRTGSVAFPEITDLNVPAGEVQRLDRSTYRIGSRILSVIRKRNSLDIYLIE